MNRASLPPSNDPSERGALIRAIVALVLFGAVIYLATEQQEIRADLAQASLTTLQNR